MVEDADALNDVSRYCCNRFKIINGAYMVAVSYCVFIISNLGIRFYKSAEVEWNWQIFFTACDTISVACLYFGLYKRRPAFLQPFTVVSILTVSFFILLTLSQAMATFDTKSYYRKQLWDQYANPIHFIAETFGISTDYVLMYAAISQMIVYAGTGCVHAWFMVIVVRCAQWLRISAEKNTSTDSLMLEEKVSSDLQSSDPTDELEKGISYL